MSGTVRQSLHGFSTDQHQASNISQLSPLLQRQWHHAKNAYFSNVPITAYSNRRVWWSCDKCLQGCKHEWAATVNNRSSGSGCPFCANRAVCSHNSLTTKAPAVAAQFSSNNTGSANDYMVSSNKIVLWRCEHGHEWAARISHRTNNHTGCPTCFALRFATQPQKRHPTLTDSQHPMMQYWDWDLNNKAGFDPSNITCRSGKKPHWICHSCPKSQPHRWQTRVCHMFDGSGCPFCVGQQTCSCNSLQSLFPAVAAEWDYSRNKGTPDEYTARSGVKMWWYNKIRGHFQSIIGQRTYSWRSSRSSLQVSTASVLQ